MDFCKNCNNGLYPTEIDNDLWLICKICEYKEKNSSSIVKKNVYKRSNIIDYGKHKYIIYDNAYPKTKTHPCPNTECPSIKDKSLQEATYFNDPKNLKITFICSACNTEWKP